MVRSGYKQTEIGLIPDDWEYGVFEDFLTGFSSGMTPYRGIRDFYNGEFPWITSGELNYNIITNTIEKITPEAIQKTNLKIIPKGTFLMAITGLEAEGTRGSCAITGIEATTNQSCMALYPIPKKITTKFLFHYYVKFGNELALKYCQGTKQQSYNAVIAKKLPIIVPPLPEQEAIAEALSDADTWIESLEQLIAKKRLIKQGALQALLTPKQGWEAKKLGEVCEFFKGKDLPKSDLSLSGKYECIHYGELFTIYNELIREIESFTSNNVNKIKSKYNDVLMPTSDVTPRGLATASCIKKDGVILGGDILIIRFKPGFDGLYFSYFITKNREEVLKYVSGSTVYHLYGSELSNLDFVFPSLSEQERIATIVSDMDAELEALEKQIHKARQIKQGMMQELLTGRVRLV